MEADERISHADAAADAEINVAGWNELHTYLKNNRPLDEIKALLGKSPDLAKGQTLLTKETPLLIGLESGADPEAILLVLAAHPAATSVAETGHWRIPLHSAAMNNYTLQVVEALYNAYPDGIQAKTIYDHTVLHMAVRNTKQVDTILFLFEKSPEQARVRNNTGETPLHVAMR